MTFRRSSGRPDVHAPGSPGLGPAHEGRSGWFLHTIERRSEGRGRERYVDVFKKGLAGDAENATGHFDEVVARFAGVFAAQRVGKRERFGQLTGAHEKAGAIDVPRIFFVHDFLHLKGLGSQFVTHIALRIFVVRCLVSVVTLRADWDPVNYTLIVQPVEFREGTSGEEWR